MIPGCDGCQARDHSKQQNKPGHFSDDWEILEASLSHQKQIFLTIVSNHVCNYKTRYLCVS